MAAVRRRRPAKAGVVTVSTEAKVTNNLDKAVTDVTPAETRHETDAELLVNPAHITVQGKITRNLGDYNSAQVTVGITRPCKDTEEDRNRVFLECSEWVENKIQVELSKV